MPNKYPKGVCLCLTVGNLLPTDHIQKNHLHSIA